MTTPEKPARENLDLILTRILDASPARVFKAYTDPEQLVQWWAPRPFTTTICEIDARAGGVFKTVMRDATGKDYPNSGIYLEIIPNQRIVFTDAYVDAWTPSPSPFFTAIISFEDIGSGKTKLVAAARHWTKENCKTHAEMGFHEGWGKCADQLNELLKATA